MKNNFAANKYRALKTNFEIMIQILFADGYGDWREVNNSNRKIQAVTAADVKRVAKEYFTKENRAVATYTRKPAAKEDKP